MKTKELHDASLDLKWTSKPFSRGLDLTWTSDRQHVLGISGIALALTRAVEIAFSMLSYHNNI